MGSWLLGSLKDRCTKSQENRYCEKTKDRQMKRESENLERTRDKQRNRKTERKISFVENLPQSFK
jgi:hypothetical protein